MGESSTHGRGRRASLLEEWKMGIEPGALVGDLNPGLRQLLKIVKALRRGVPVIILDEPTAALSHAEKLVLFEHVKSLKKAGVSFVYISHHLDEVFEVADGVTILRDGQVVAERLTVEGLDVETLANLMMGGKTVRSSRIDYTNLEALPLLVAKDIRLGPLSTEGIDFEVRPGEIVALAGPVGGGKEDLGTVLAGQQKPYSGTISSPGGALPTIGFVPTDRHASGYVGILGVRENVVLGGLDVLSGRVSATIVGVSRPERVAQTITWANSTLSEAVSMELAEVGYETTDPEAERCYTPG